MQKAESNGAPYGKLDHETEWASDAKYMFVQAGLVVDKQNLDSIKGLPIETGFERDEVIDRDWHWSVSVGLPLSIS